MLKNGTTERDHVFTFNPFFEDKPLVTKMIKDKEDEFIFPIKIFLDSSKNDVKNMKKKNDLKNMKNIKFKVLIICNKLFKYLDNTGRELMGYPWFFETVSMQ